MIELLLVGIGTGNPEHLTLQAQLNNIGAMERLDQHKQIFLDRAVD